MCEAAALHVCVCLFDLYMCGFSLMNDERLSVCYPGPARFRGIRVVVADACNKRRVRPCLVRFGGCSWECLQFIYIYALYLMKPGCMYAGRVRASCMHKTAVLHL